MPLEVMVFVNNDISARMARAVLDADRISLDRVFLIQQRPLTIDWFSQLGKMIGYPHRSPSRWNYYRGLLRHFMAVRRAVMSLKNDTSIKRVLIVNSDNVFSNHLLNRSEAGKGPDIEVITEGIMNFQDIQLRNRGRLQILIKGWIAPLFGLSWIPPVGHLSGSFHPAVKRVHAFSAKGLMAPPEKVVTRTFQRVQVQRQPDTRTLFIVLSGVHVWMKPEDVEKFGNGFVSFVESLGFDQILLKRHPRFPDGPFISRIKGKFIDDPRCIEDMASEIPASTVLGYNCTGLVTLKMMRPDLRCIDFGADFYGDAAYHGDHSVETLLTAAGVELVPLRGASLHKFVGPGTRSELAPGAI
jgi:hypothetical protein